MKPSRSRRVPIIIISMASLMGAGFVLAKHARAADDELKWDLGAEAFRYDLEEDDQQRLVPDAGLATVFVKSQLLAQSDLDQGRKWKIDPRDASELTWYVAFMLPPNGITAPIQEKCKGWPGGALSLEGTDEVKRTPQGKVILKATVDLAQAVGSDKNVSYWDKGSKLVVERSYLDKKKQVTDARFELDVHLVRDGKNFVFHHAGKITLAGKVDASLKGFLGEVQAAIRRGSSWTKDSLKKRLAAYKANPPDKAPQWALGKIALPTFALLRSGVPPAELADAFDYMSRCELREVYSVSLYIMCLEAKSVKREEVPASAGGRTVARYHKDPVPPIDKKEMLRAARWLIAVRKHGEGWWSYKGDPGTEPLDAPTGKGTTAKNGSKPGDPGVTPGHPVGNDNQPNPGGDRSNTQFATLALHVASTSDLPIEPEVWKEIADELLQAQEQNGPAVSIASVEWSAAAPVGIVPDGGADPYEPLATRSKEKRERELGEGTRARGWAYAVHAAIGGGGYGSMSGAGLSSAAVAREALRRAGKLDTATDDKTRKMILDGVAWWMENWSPARNPKSSAWYYYYLYSVEKAMETAGVERLGPHDWWKEGCQQILALEDGKKGRWTSGANGMEDTDDTSFALLFLNRATLPATITTQDTIKSASGEASSDAWDQVFVEKVGHVRLRQVLFAVETATAELVKDRLEVATKGFEVLDEDKRPRLVPDLIHLLSTGNKDIRKFAQRQLQISCGTDDEQKCRAFHNRWLELVKACEVRDADSIPKARSILKDPDATVPLKRAACVALSRLTAVEALGDLIAELSSNDPSYRRQVATTMVQLAGGEKCSYDPSGPDADRAKQQADWKAWWEKERTGLVAEQEARTLVLDLASPKKADAAETKLKAIGKRAVRALIDGLQDENARPRAHSLLLEITGASLPAESGPWMEWWQKNK